MFIYSRGGSTISVSDSIFLLFDRKMCEEIKVKLHAICKDNDPSKTTARYWFNEFKGGRTSVSDEKRRGFSTDVTMDDVVNKIYDTVL